MTVPLYTVDAFTDRPFAGNPAAVCVLDRWRADDWLQAVAREMNLSETAFLVRGDDGFHLRWMTPTVEVDLCGHATLASAHVLWEAGYAPRDRDLRFHTRSGVLGAARRGDEIELDFPLKPPQPVEAPAGLSQALGATPRYVGQNGMDFLVELDSEEVVRTLTPDFKQLATVPARGIIVTSRAAAPPFDFVSRFFAPASGIDEDPVTGSAHCCLGPFWQQRLHKNELLAYQASARGGIVRVRVTDTRALLAGRAVTIAKGELLA